MVLDARPRCWQALGVSGQTFLWLLVTSGSCLCPLGSVLDPVVNLLCPVGLRLWAFSPLLGNSSHTGAGTRLLHVPLLN